jgi:hypothetical protein
MENRGPEVHIEKEDARSGATPGVVRYVLLISLVLAIIAMAAIWITGAASTPDTGGAADTTKAVAEHNEKAAP